MKKILFIFISMVLIGFAFVSGCSYGMKERQKAKELYETLGCFDGIDITIENSILLQLTLSDKQRAKIIDECVKKYDY